MQGCAEGRGVGNDKVGDDMCSVWRACSMRMVAGDKVPMIGGYVVVVVGGGERRAMLCSSFRKYANGTAYGCHVQRKRCKQAMLATLRYGQQPTGGVGDEAG